MSPRAFSCALIALSLAACGGGGGPAGPIATNDTGGVIRTAGGAAVSEVAHNHWRDAIEMFRTHDRAAGGWSSANCEATLTKFRQANEAQGGRFTEAVFMQGVVSARCGQQDQASQLYRQALQMNERYCGARVGVGLDDMRAGRVDQARQHFERAIREDARCTSGYVNLAIIQRSQPNQAAEALNNLRRALAIESDYLPAFNQMALLYLDQAANNRQMLDLAEVVCRQAQLINGNYAPIYNTWGLINHRQGNIIAALAKFERAFQLDNNFFEALMNFGQLTLSYRGYDDAARAFERANQLQANNYDALLGLGAALRGLNRLEDAEAKYRAAIALDGQRAEAYYNLGLLYQDYMGGQVAQLEQAQQFYQQFLQRAGQREQFAPAVQSVSRRCREESQSSSSRRRRRRSTDCRPGRIQQIETAIRLMREMAQMQQQVQQLEQQQQQQQQQQEQQEQQPAPAPTP